MSGMPWFKVWNEMPLDKKWRSISAEIQWTVMSLIGFWTTLMCFASDSPVRGKLYVTPSLRVTDEFLAKFFDIELCQADELISAFILADLLEEDEDGVLGIKHWEERQKSPDPTAAKRMREFRERETKSVTRNVTRNEPEMLRVEDRGQRIDIKEEEEEGVVPAFASICQKYSQEIGALTPRIRDVLIEAMKDYPEPGWIEAAIDEAARNNARRWPYAAKILERWKVEGFQSVGRKNGSGSGPKSNVQQNFENIAEGLRRIKAKEVANGNT